MDLSRRGGLWICPIGGDQTDLRRGSRAGAEVAEVYVAS